MDEPTSNLDIKHQMEVTRILRDLFQKKGILVIMISHDLNIAAKYSDTMMMLAKGSIFAIGTPSEVLTKENVKEVYGVDSDVVEIHGRPHIIMLDEEFDSSYSPLPEGTFATSSKPMD